MKMGMRSHGADAFNDLSLYATSRQRVEVWVGKESWRKTLLVPLGAP